MSDPAAKMNLVPLTTLSDGMCATVELREMCRDDCELLSAMGLTDRCRLRICRIGEPCIIQVAATRLGLSSTMASKIMVRPDPASD
ncbi:MAG: ferrous iron transport protein A [Planctomycetes bacterium]|nr:ferrous iron transport protein A [Planctomycetota bacterium]